MMAAPASIFLDFNLPNATTWFYFSFLLAVALFFKFSRVLSIRNWDVITLFLLVPGFLLLQEAHGLQRDAALHAGNASRSLAAFRWLWLGYVWLLIGSAYFLLRCLIDLALVRRPALGPNLNLGGLAWLAGALFVSLIAVAARQPSQPADKDGKAPASIGQFERIYEKTTPKNVEGLEPQTWVDRSLAVLCHLAVVVGLVLVGWRHFQDLHGGMAAATFYLLLPYTFLLMPGTELNVGQWHHALPMALVIWAVAAFRIPTVAGLLFGLAAGIVYFPALVVPVWISFYWRRGAGRFFGAFLAAACLSLAVTGTSLWLQGKLDSSLHSAVGPDWQAWQKPTTESFWLGLNGKGVHWAYRIPIFIGYLAFVLTTAFWPMPKNLAHVLALSAAVLIGPQFWYADHGGVYVLWYLPLLLLLVFRPNLAECRPISIQPESDRLARLGRTFKNWIARLRKLPEPLARAR